MASCDVKSVIKALQCLTPIVMWYIYYSVFLCSMCNLGSFFVFDFLLRARTRFLDYCVQLLVFKSCKVSSFLRAASGYCGSVVTLAVMFVAACEVHCSSVRLARDHSECGPFSLFVNDELSLHENAVGFFYVFVRCPRRCWICVRHGQGGWYIWSSARRLCAAWTGRQGFG